MNVAQGEFNRHAFVEGMSITSRQCLAEQARPFEAAVGTYLVREGEAATMFYLLNAGRVAIGAHLGERGATPIQTVGSNEVVGWSWLLEPHLWQFDACVVEPVRGHAIDASWLREQCEQNHDLGFHVLKKLLAVVSGRLAAERMQRMDIYR